MTTSAHLKALIRSHAEGDNERFFSIAMQAAAHAARSGHTKLAQELRDLVVEAKKRGGQAAAGKRLKPVPLVQPRGELAGLLSVSYPESRLTDMALDEAVKARLHRVLREQRQRDRLRGHGLEPQRKLLLVGAPGTGKTMTAAALAGELGLPRFTIQLHGLITKFMGETAAKLRLVFDAVRETRGVYLFDEFDAVGSERGAPNDVGEIRRVLNSFLMFLEQEESDSLIVAATNHPRMLDRALFRRFDAVIEYGLPSHEVAIEILRSRLAFLDTDRVAWDTAASAAEGLSHGEIVRACEHVAKAAVLDDHLAVETKSLVQALKERRASHEQ